MTESDLWWDWIPEDRWANIVKLFNAAARMSTMPPARSDTIMECDK